MIAWLLERPRAVCLYACGLLAVGIWAGARAPLEWVPSVELPQVAVTASWPGASPRAVERWVAAPIERVAASIPGTVEVESHAGEGFAVLRVGVEEDRDIALYSAELSDRLAALRSSLPERVVPRISREVPAALRDEQGFMTLKLVGDVEPVELRRLADSRLAPQLRSLAGISSVAVEGGAERELLIRFDREKLQAYRLLPEHIQEKLREASFDQSFGWMSHPGGQSLLLKTAGWEEVLSGRLPLASDAATGRVVRLGDVAQVELGPGDARSLSRIDGMPVVSLVLDRAPGTHLLSVARAVEERLAALRSELPPRVRILTAEDRSEHLREQLRDLLLQALLGLAAVGVVLRVMLHGFRAALIVLTSLAVALAVALALLGPLGLTLNILTLSGLVLLDGLLLDNAVVLLERIQAERARGAGLREAARRALGAVWIPQLGGTAATVAALVPVVYLSRELRPVFQPFAILVALTFLCSLVSAALLIPALVHTLAPETAHRRRNSPGLRRTCLRLFLFPHRVAVRFPRTILAVLLLCIGVPVVFLPERIEPGSHAWRALYNRTLGSEAVLNLRRTLDPMLGGATRAFVRNVELGRSWRFDERDEVTLSLKLPAGSGIERTDALMRGFESRALKEPAVRQTIVTARDDAATLRVTFHESQERERLAVRDALIREALHISGVEVVVSGLLPMSFYSGLGDVASLRVEAFGPNYDELRKISSSFAQRLRKHPGFAQVDIDAGRRGRLPGREVLRLHWGDEAVARTGIHASGLTRLLRADLAGSAPAFLASFEGNSRLPVRIAPVLAADLDLDALVSRPLRAGQSDESFRLSELAEIAAEREAPVIERFNHQYKRSIDISYLGPFELGEKILARELKAFPLPPGLRLEAAGEAFLSEGVRREIFPVLCGTVFLVFLVIAAVLESWKLAGLSMISLPMAWLGVALAFSRGGEAFAEGAFIGSILVIGTAVNDSILLADQYRRLHRVHPSLPTGHLALVAVRSRLRPMWTTLLCSLVGVLPILLLAEAGTFWRGLALTVASGLLSAALLAPLAMVAMLSLRRGASSSPPAAG
ncbi:MAG TPA: efflux RND transporter permease subunit [Thermoanaerobaculia bacterium]